MYLLLEEEGVENTFYIVKNIPHSETSLDRNMNEISI